MSVFISDIDTAKLYVQFFRRLAQRAVSLVLIYMNKTVSVRIQQLKNKGVVQLDNSKSGRGRKESYDCNGQLSPRK